MSQEKRILIYLKAGHKLTPMDALKRFGCWRLGARILALRDRGHRIITVMVDNGEKRFARYHLERSA